MHQQWIVTIDGEPVAGTNAYTRKDAIDKFCDQGCRGEPSWKDYRAAGYAVIKVSLKK